MELSVQQQIEYDRGPTIDDWGRGIRNSVSWTNRGYTTDYAVVNSDSTGVYKFFWVTQQHDIFYIPDMSTSHLFNIVRMGAAGHKGKLKIMRAVLRQKQTKGKIKFV